MPAVMICFCLAPQRFVSASGARQNWPKYTTPFALTDWPWQAATLTMYSKLPALVWVPSPLPKSESQFFHASVAMHCEPLHHAQIGLIEWSPFHSPYLPRLLGLSVPSQYQAQRLFRPLPPHDMQSSCAARPTSSSSSVSITQ